MPARAIDGPALFNVRTHKHAATAVAEKCACARLARPPSQRRPPRVQHRVRLFFRTSKQKKKWFRTFWFSSTTIYRYQAIRRYVITIDNVFKTVHYSEKRHQIIFAAWGTFELKKKNMYTFIVLKYSYKTGTYTFFTLLAAIPSVLIHTVSVFPTFELLSEARSSEQISSDKRIIIFRQV